MEMSFTARVKKTLRHGPWFVIRMHHPPYYRDLCLDKGNIWCYATGGDGCSADSPQRCNATAIWISSGDLPQRSGDFMGEAFEPGRPGEPSAKSGEIGYPLPINPC
ncbi:uncharacterized protein LOC144142175 [Haemaphysalis longicornis]